MEIIRDSTVNDIKILLQSIRPEDSLEALRLGFDAEAGLYRTYNLAVYKKTALIDNEIAAMWGVCGSVLSITGQPYLVTGSHVTKTSPYRFISIYKEEVQKMRKLFPVLENFVDAEYTSSIRVLKLIGFTLEGPVVLNNNNFYKFSIGGE